MQSHNIPEKLFLIASAARKATERFAELHPQVGDKQDLTCYCAIGSKILYKLAKTKGFNVVLVQGFYNDGYWEECEIDKNSQCVEDINHCWVQWRGEVIDITATQFKGVKEKIYVPGWKHKKKYFAVQQASEFEFYHLQCPNRWVRSINTLVHHAAKQL